MSMRSSDKVGQISHILFLLKVFLFDNAKWFQKKNEMEQEIPEIRKNREITDKLWNNNNNNCHVPCHVPGLQVHYATWSQYLS